MDFNTFFLRFGLDNSNFVNKPIEIVKNDNYFIYETEEIKREHLCPICNYPNPFVHAYSWVQIKLSTSIGVNEILRVKRIRYICPVCNRTHTLKLIGIERNKTISEVVKTAIQNEFYEVQSFSTIAKRYDVSLNTVINIFDEYTKVMPRLKLPKYLCIDEKHFEGDTNGKYCVVLSDFFTGEIIDIIKNRQMPYLEQYFSSISQSERDNVKVFISDMYEGYSKIKNKYFPKAVFVIDLFHVVKLLSTAVNQLRIRTYNQYIPENTIEKHFMKTNWKIFLKDQFKINKNYYHSLKYDISLPYGEIILKCLKYNPVFWDAYHILQELTHYDKYDSYTLANKFILRIIAKLNSSGDELLEKVGKTYSKWIAGITNGLAKNQTGKRFSNSIAENNNSHIQRLIDVAYGYKNFIRFRARVMLISSYKKTR